MSKQYETKSIKKQTCISVTCDMCGYKVEDENNWSDGTYYDCSEHTYFYATRSLGEDLLDDINPDICFKCAKFIFENLHKIHCLNVKDRQ